MSNFTEPLDVRKVSKREWKVLRSFDYHVGSKESEDVVTVPEGFITDFASVPRIFWAIYPPDGGYTQAAVLHDFLYNEHKRERKMCDLIFLEAMNVLKVSGFARKTIFWAVRALGWIPWRKKK